MRNVTRADIACNGSVIEAIYDSATTTQLLSAVAGEPVFPCPYEPEQFVITRLEEVGDTHGWHWDDYSFALVWVAKCLRPTMAGSWSASRTRRRQGAARGSPASAGSSGTQVDGRCGDVYLMRTNTTLHRVCPIRGGRRTIVNMAFASAGELNAVVSHETMDSLWSRPGAE
ncbi:HalD/BesD family halogenase [Nocardia vinacea]|uniref:HalD/BesD family halogenase n=1 Tax=Nocardia vinacea TaxID=96468 RepID=UPI003F4D63F3